MPTRDGKDPSSEGIPEESGRSKRGQPNTFFEFLKMIVFAVLSVLGGNWWRRHVGTADTHVTQGVPQAPSGTEIPGAGGKGAATQESPTGHERRDISVRGIVVFVVIMALGAVMIQVGLWIWLKALLKRYPPHEARQLTRPAQEVPALASNYPKLQISPRQDWQAYLAEQKNVLNSSGWVDRSNGIVRIPISEAIEMVAVRGLPVWGATNRSISPLELQQQRALEERRQGR